MSDEELTIDDAQEARDRLADAFGGECEVARFEQGHSVSVSLSCGAVRLRASYSPEQGWYIGGMEGWVDTSADTAEEAIEAIRESLRRQIDEHRAEIDDMQTLLGGGDE